MANPSAQLHASPLFLRDTEVRRGYALLSAAQAQLAKSVDPILAEHGLGRAHQRALYFIGRKPGLTVGALIALLGITKQSLGRVSRDLQAQGLVAIDGNDDDRRQKLLRLTPRGERLEAQLFEALGERLRAAYGQAGQDAVSGFWQVLDGLLPVAERGLLRDLDRLNG